MAARDDMASGKGRGAPKVEDGARGRGGASTAALAAAAEEAKVAAATPNTGLTKEQVADAQAKHGFNELIEVKKNPILVFLAFFWGPVAAMIWLAIIVEAINQGWEDFGVLLFLQLANGFVGWYEEKNAGNAIEALKQQLGATAFVCRGGVWARVPARELVPGDLVDLAIGAAVPADAILRGDAGAADSSLLIDQSALTGESLPVEAFPGFRLMMGSIVRRGEGHAVIVATGERTFFGKAAALISKTESKGRFQRVVFLVTLVMLAMSALLCSIILTVLLLSHSSFLSSLSIVIVLLVASIPVAMQVVCTSTMAAGSRELAHAKVIVAKLSAIEELAGMDMLCSDKTGTLTTNKLSLRPPMSFSGMSDDEMTFMAALSCKRTAGNQDAIDTCITSAVADGPERERLAAHVEVAFMPFNPTDKRTQSVVRAPDGAVFSVSKGAPQVILQLCGEGASAVSATARRVEAAVQEYADRGFRGIGLAKCDGDATKTASPEWEFVGLLSLYDPPREDTKITLKEAAELGVDVKMITGDHTAIAKETCRELGLGTNVLRSDVLDSTDGQALDDLILQAHGFAEVMPEHKYRVVDRLRAQGHVCGMTGDGVNDAPALKRADIGIAVQGATDAAKSAASIVLVEPGLHVIVQAIHLSREIFQRMRNYMIYRIATTIQLLVFFFVSIILFNPADLLGDPLAPTAFTLPVTALVITTLLNDGAMMSIAKDRVDGGRTPLSWDLPQIFAISSTLGVTACIGSVLLLAALLASGPQTPTSAFYIKWLAPADQCDAADLCYLTYGQIQTIMWLKISLSDFLTIFSARTAGHAFSHRPSAWLAGAAIIAMTTSSIIAVTTDLAGKEEDSNSHNHMLKVQGDALLFTWLYVLVGWAFQDAVKVLIIFLFHAYSRKPIEDRMEVTAAQRDASTAHHHAYLAATQSGLVSEEAKMKHVMSMRFGTHASAASGLPMRRGSISSPTPAMARTASIAEADDYDIDLALDEGPSSAEFARLKRRVADLEEQVTKLKEDVGSIAAESKKEM
eukprot:CAMPEP_0203810634 /NCGR_PEP_ID=MMETSP0115-20131106/3060_1 /ASSEMBLY_ACC=CAM_ASM_000227 /TAXON_ID=33651 /ORGANISM="Bicosoecid sp, Strain ms1" /LENGTH=1027 /DNA_ID=CAMNT_0050719435 /DNA_START=46 /DNA_END=3129 /DNA_ORIENTATION=-